MKKWITFLTCTACAFSSTVQCDEALPLSAETSLVEAEQDPSEEEPTLAVTPNPEDAPKQVGKAATDGADTAGHSKVFRYALAATAVTLGITAIILVSKHDGHRPHHH